MTSTVCVNTLQSGRGSRLGSARSRRGTDDSDDDFARKRSGFGELDLECPPHSVLPWLSLISLYGPDLTSDSDHLGGARDDLTGRGSGGEDGAGGGTRDGNDGGGRQRTSVNRQPKGSKDANLSVSGLSMQCWLPLNACWLR